MAKFYNLSIFAALILFTFSTLFEIALSLSSTHKIPTLQHIPQLTPKNALENPHTPPPIPKVQIVYPLSKPKVSPTPSPNKSLPSHLTPKTSTITMSRSQSTWDPLAPKSPIKQNLSPKSIEKHTSKSILTPKVTKTSPISKLAPRPASRKYLPIHLAPKIQISKQNLSPKSSPKPTRNHGSKFFQVRPKVGSHVSPKLAPITYKQKVNPTPAPKSTTKFSHLAPKSTVAKPNVLLNPTGKIITKTRLAPKEAPKLTHKLTRKHGTH
ncbi:hypothetical protein HAX54_017199 [Datura stramonium]|uniref:Uncharacterized protein n=1 Tax=Datura stramonium TaxID=4076 RepID=A0ABS8S0Z9_DATST|nr:hypothetical protein [Datura stramonium]